MGESYNTGAEWDLGIISTIPPFLGPKKKEN